MLVRDFKLSKASLVSYLCQALDLLVHGKVWSRIINIRRRSCILISAFSEGPTLLEYVYGYSLE